LRKIDVYVSAEILSYLNQNYPWILMDDPAWKGYILSWYTLIQQKISKIAKIVSSPVNCNKNSCSGVSLNVSHLFSSFLSSFATLNMPNNMAEEGVISICKCDVEISHPHLFYVKIPSDLNFVEYPWLRIYDKELPPSGNYHFTPPRNWRTQPRPSRGRNFGYLDDNGVEWCWDTLHKNHWDVQDGSPYTNVSPDGRVLP
jgi:hypothetical protein